MKRSTLRAEIYHGWEVRSQKAEGISLCAGYVLNGGNLSAGFQVGSFGVCGL